MIFSAILLFILAYYLNGIRDLERGFLPARPGKSHASPLLQSPIGLVFRLPRVGIISWAIGMFVLGASYGSVFGDLESFFSDNELLEQLLAGGEGLTIVEQFIPIIIVVNALIASIPPIIAMNKLYSEEKRERLDSLLGTALSRTRLFGSYAVIAVVNSVVMLFFVAIGLWSAGYVSMDGDLSFCAIIESTLAYFPAVLVMIGISALLIGWLPKFTNIIWVYLLYSFIVIYFGELFQFADWVGKTTPFGYVPQGPIEEITTLPLFILSLLAIVLFIFGFIGFNRRDIQ